DPRVADYSNSGLPSSTATSTPTPIVSYNLGVYGTGNTLVLSNYRVRKGPAAPTDVPDPVITSDVQRTAYWVVANGTDAVGLARAEIRQATSPDSDTVDLTALVEQNKYVIAPEVKSVLFEDFDGTTWQASWDGTFSASTDGSSPPQGPPAAIRITITLKRNVNRTATPDHANLDGTTYMHAVPLPTPHRLLL